MVTENITNLKENTLLEKNKKFFFKNLKILQIYEYISIKI